MVLGLDQLGALRLDEPAPCGSISIYDIDPEFHILVEHPPKRADGLPIYSLDDGIIEGALMSRYPPESGVNVTRTAIEDGNMSVKYEINFNS